MLKQIAPDFAENEKAPEFQVSERWMTRFKNQNKIKFKLINGEVVDVNIETIEKWKRNLPEIMKNFDAVDIFNADETNMFFRVLPNKTMAVRMHGWENIKKKKTCRQAL